MSIALIFLMWFIMYKTTFGLRLRGVGMNSTASQTIGISVRRYQWYATLILGVFGGLGGAVLPLGRNFYFLGKHDGGPRLFSGCGCYGWKGKSASDGGILPAVFLYRRIVAAAAKRWHSVAVSGDVPLYYDDFGPGNLQRQAVTEKDVPQEITFVRKIPLS